MADERILCLELEAMWEDALRERNVAVQQIAEVRHWFDEAINEAEQNCERSTLIEWLEAGRALVARP